MNKSEVAENRADLAVTSFMCTPEFLGSVECSQAIYYGSTYWITKAPTQLLKATNILRIFDATGWILIFLSILSIITFFYFGSKIGRCYGLKVEYCEVPLVPSFK